ncbi:sigma-70 family RNA polymerase sigma factor [Euhalothece natronophila Z-M001]|uniref:Sigma-70 family RNA polymerase sigma factor n=1 Tax=Euhalothece natronophila Z-M001 TaxID=522448 RepID=A0A5B8NL78_9CHRO|nr:sigma-70 family RNA polymerase sigma factor [Euhalothece natronophila]QDZ40022.1 sigma-70 family RNA polymerase sigma factor [Euhalothece natronophila Z-M001]
MYPRKDVVALFSTFLQFDQEQFRGWASDPRLHRSMEKSLAAIAETSDQFWVQYWHKHWQDQSSPLARGHLSAYLQEPAYWAAYHITRSFSQLSYSLADCFQIAIAELDTVIKGFNPDKNSSLKGYARAIFNSTIKGILRQRQETDICSDWGLLRKLSQKRVKEALEQQGFSSTEIAAYTLAWHCFNENYVPEPGQKTRQLKRPEAETWSAIAQCYNNQARQNTPPMETVTQGEQLESWLLKIAKVARSYLYPTVSSTDQPISEGDNQTFADTLADANTPTPLTEIISAEEQKQREVQQGEMSLILKSAIAQLDSKQQALLDYYYHQGYTQTEIAKALNIKQYKVSRQLNKIRKTLLQNLAQWSEKTLHIQLSSNLLKEMSGVLEEWLTTHYSPIEEQATQESP